jgi:hypothetical protein
VIVVGESTSLPKSGRVLGALRQGGDNDLVEFHHALKLSITLVDMVHICKLSRDRNTW